ncbi:MAG: ABC transporter substrate-binding protein [Chloroflexota bacterium]
MTKENLWRPTRLTRRQVLGGVASVLAVSALAACATPPAAAPAATNPPAAPKEKAKILYAWPFAAIPTFQEEVAKRFMEKNKNIEVEVLIIPQEQVLPKLTSAFSGGVGPDVVAMSPAWISQFASAGWLENLEERLESSGLDKEMLPVGMMLGRLYKNTAYMAGFLVDNYPLFYNKQMFADAGLKEPPKTQEEFAQYAKKMTDASKNKYGHYLLGTSGWSFQQWCLWMAGEGGLGDKGTLYDASGKCILGGAKHVAGLDKWLNMYKVDKSTPPASAGGGYQDASNAFNAGQIGMVMGFLGYITEFNKGLGKDKFGVAPLPAGPAGTFYHYACNGYALGAQSKQKEAAWEFVKFMLSKEMNSEIAKQWGGIPSIAKALDDDWLKDPVFDAPKMMAQKTETFVNTPRQLAGWGAFFQTFGPEQIQKALAGQQTAEQTAKAVADNQKPPHAKG